MDFLLFLCLHTGCQFPERWWGSWIRKGVSELIHISKYNISDKGICRKNNKEKYIIENRYKRFSIKIAFFLFLTFYYFLEMTNVFDVCLSVKGIPTFSNIKKVRLPLLLI